jgi:hypothetical protein
LLNTKGKTKHISKMAANTFENIECHDCPMDHGKRCPKPGCKHCLEHVTNTESEILALPYTYVDVFPDAGKLRSKEEAVRLQEKHYLHSATSNGKIVTRIQTAMVDHGAAKTLSGSKFVAEIEGVEFAGSVVSNLIDAENTRNETARTIASSRSKDASASPVLWIPIPADEKTRVFDQIQVSLTTNEHPDPVKYEIAIPSDAESVSASIGDRKLRAFAERQLRMKGYNPATHSAYTAGHVRVIVDNNTRQLKDVEIDMVEPAALPEHVQEFVCDPLDIDAVTGLTAALEEHIASNPETTARAAEVFSTVNAHRQALEKHLLSNGGETIGYQVTPTVNAAINEATDIMWEEVGTKIRVNRYYNRLRKSIEGRGMEWLKDKVKELIDDYQTLLNMETESKMLKKAWYRAKRAAKKADGRDMIKAINRRLQEAGQLKPDIIAELQTRRDELVPVFGQ